jgi:hypothetical protein
MSQIKLIKLLASPGGSRWPAEYNSAVWQVAGMPWLVIGKWNRSEGSGWMVHVYDYFEMFPQQDKERSRLVKQRIEGQIFRTRLEALQALQIALEL